MLRTIRARFAAILLVGTVSTFLTLRSTGQIADPALIASVVMLASMLIIEMAVIRPVSNLSREVVSIVNDDTGLDRRLTAGGADEIATLARTINGLIEHMSSRRVLEKRLEHMAHHDSLTGLPNRLSFHQALAHEVARVRRGGQPLAVLYLDLDGFKCVNDTLGHHMGDRLLGAVSERLRRTVRDTDIVARMGGDEFAIIQTAADEPRCVTILAERLIEALEKPFDLDGHHAIIGTSIGISLAPSDSLEVETLIKSADLALYRAKAEGRGLFRYFEPEMDSKMQARRLLEADLRSAMANEEFEVYYQPILDAHTLNVSGFEALARWNHPSRGVIPPSEFIPLAEETGLIVPLGDYVLRQACLQASTWGADLKIAVNLSPVQFKNRSLARNVEAALEGSGLQPHRLELEITESVLLQDNEATLATLHQLRALGVRIAMDDFGTGYSSLSYLRSFPFDRIKIDRSFVTELSDTGGQSVAIIRAVANLGSNLGMSTTAEGVETQEQLGLLSREGCTEVQGYLFSKPIPASAVAPYLQAAGLERKSAA